MWIFKDYERFVYILRQRIELKMPDISTKLLGIRLRNPTILTSGILGVTAASLLRIANSGAGAITTKSIGPVKREGHPNPIVVEVQCGLLNSVGLSCPPMAESLHELKNLLKKVKIPVIASFYGRTPDEFGEIAARISELKPDFLEANISCPNLESESGRPFSTDGKISAKITREIKNSSNVPLIMKLSPNVSDITKIAKKVEEAGADIISCINSYGPGMVIDIETGAPVLGNRFGGLSGPGIKPIALRCVYEIYGTVKIPVIGIGGISTGKDAVEMLMAGASAVGIGTAVMYDGIEVFEKISQELEKFMETHNYGRVEELIGKAQDYGNRL
jgi:dihydroorotate dehydrogenase (NAD+) catalytic subunit